MEEEATRGQLMRISQLLDEKKVSAARLENLLRTGLLADLLEIDLAIAKRNEIALVSGVKPYEVLPYREPLILRPKRDVLVNQMAREMEYPKFHHKYGNGFFELKAEDSVLLRMPVKKTVSKSAGKYHFFITRRKLNLDQLTLFFERDGFEHADLYELLAFAQTFYKKPGNDPYLKGFCAGFSISPEGEIPVLCFGDSNRGRLMRLEARKIEEFDKHFYVFLVKEKEQAASGCKEPVAV